MRRNIVNISALINKLYSASFGSESDCVSPSSVSQNQLEHQSDSSYCSKDTVGEESSQLDQAQKFSWTKGESSLNMVEVEDNEQEDILSGKKPD